MRRRRTPLATSSILHTPSTMKNMVVMKLIALLFCLISESIRASTTKVLREKAASAESPRAITVIDPHKVGEDVIFHPVPSCMSEVILVIYIQSLELLNRLHVFKDMYGPFVKEVEFYVDGTWCDPRADGNKNWAPCYGPPLDRSIIPEEVHVVDHSGGGWLMQRSLIDAMERPRGGADAAGFLFITDDVLLNLGRLTRAVRVSGCEVIWRSTSEICQDVNSKIKHAEIFYGLLSKARQFSLLADERFNEQITRNLGSPSTYCLGYQNDFIYIPISMATAWTKVARQMTELGLVFTFTFSTAIYGIAPMEDMIVLRTRYLPRQFRADTRLEGAKFNGESQPYCWTGKGDARELLAMHIVHPNKIAFSEKSWDFARTVNSPWTASAVNSSTSSLESSSDGNAARPTVQATAASTFWCPKQ